MVRAAPTGPTTAKMLKPDWRRAGRRTISSRNSAISRRTSANYPQVDMIGPEVRDLGLDLGPEVGQLRSGYQLRQLAVSKL